MEDFLNMKKTIALLSLFIATTALQAGNLTKEEIQIAQALFAFNQEGQFEKAHPDLKNKWRSVALKIQELLPTLLRNIGVQNKVDFSDDELSLLKAAVLKNIKRNL